MLALHALEGHAERFFERGADCGEARVPAMLDAELGFVRVGCKKPGQVGRRIDLRGQQQGALKEFDEALADQGGFLAGVVGIRPELVFSACQAVGFQLDRLAFGIAAQQDKIAIVGHQDLFVAAPVFADLLAIGGDPGVVGGGLDFDYAARRDACARGFGAALGKLIGSEKPAIGIARAAVLQL